jgi:2-C-methyl-D-erythritol 4-phosphate cytidylyltransferase
MIGGIVKKNIYLMRRDVVVEGEEVNMKLTYLEDTYVLDKYFSSDQVKYQILK